jgi:protein-tyrosine phosphatase/membrane-associated phospholipid phosphatase
MGNVHGVDRPPYPLSGVTAFALSLLFIVVYGLAGWLTSLRADVGTWVFDWERSLPFVPWLIVPYMSLDLFFVAAPFLCHERRELVVLRRRMTMAIVIAGTMFFLMPLRFAFPRPEPADWTAAIFQVLHGLDRPFNLFPSLHISILMILCGTYDRHTRGYIRWLTHGWFALIGISTVLTYQHHVIDVVAGLALGALCYYSIPERSTQQPVTTNARIGAWYAVVTVVLGAAGAYLGPWGLTLLWPATSTAIVAGAYFGLYSGITRKEDGRIPLASRIVLAPWLIAQSISLIYYRRQAAPWSVVAPHVWMGRQLREGEANQAIRQGVNAVLDLTGEFSETQAFRALPYLSLPVLDLTTPTRDQLRAAVEFISAHRHHGAVYVHCKIGFSRSAAVVGAWLMDVGIAATAQEAVRRIRSARPGVIVRGEVICALQDFHGTNRAVNATLIEVQA